MLGKLQKLHEPAGRGLLTHHTYRRLDSNEGMRYVCLILTRTSADVVISSSPGILHEI